MLLLNQRISAILAFTVIGRIEQTADGAADGFFVLGGQNDRIFCAVKVKNAVALFVKIGIEIGVPALIGFYRDLFSVIKPEIKVDGVLVKHMLDRRLDVGFVINRSFYVHTNDLAAVGAIDQLLRNTRDPQRYQHSYDIAEDAHIGIIHIEDTLAPYDQQRAEARKQDRAGYQSFKHGFLNMLFQIGR